MATVDIVCPFFRMVISQLFTGWSYFSDCLPIAPVATKVVTHMVAAAAAESERVPLSALIVTHPVHPLVIGSRKTLLSVITLCFPWPSGAGSLTTKKET
jgi:hypothetical protein